MPVKNVFHETLDRQNDFFPLPAAGCQTDPVPEFILLVRFSPGDAPGEGFMKAANPVFVCSPLVDSTPVKFQLFHLSPLSGFIHFTFQLSQLLAGNSF
jgi:hypothetical protein